MKTGYYVAVSTIEDKRYMRLVETPFQREEFMRLAFLKFGNDRVVKTFDTQSECIAFAKKIIDQNHGRLF